MEVKATQEALDHLNYLKERYGSRLVFHQSGGCCDGSSPMCYPEDDFLIGDRDVLLGEIGGIRSTLDVTSMISGEIPT